MYTTSQHTSNQKPVKPTQNHGNAAGSTVGTNSSRNAKVSQNQNSVGIKSSSLVVSQVPASTAEASAYKSASHIPSSIVQGGSKVFKAPGYEDAKGINERFIDLNKVSDNAPKAFEAHPVEPGA